MSDLHLEEFHIDVLREIANIGAGHATTALSEFLSRPISMSVPKVNILPFDEVPNVVGGPEELVAGVYLRFEGQAPGSLMLLLRHEDAVKMTGILLNKDLETQSDGTNRPIDLGEMEQSALMETGNIVANSYLNALSSMTKIEVTPSIPALSIDMAGAILEVILFQVDEEVSEQVVLISTDFVYDGNTVRGHFFLIPDVESFPIILSSLGIGHDHGHS